MFRKELDTSQTIFALTTGKLPSAVAVVRLAGPEAIAIASRLSPSPFERVREMKTRVLIEPDGTRLDKALTLTFVSPNSFTGEDIVELHCHGSVAIVERLFQLLSEFGARPAERGEFSYRAFLNGKMTADELETLGDVFQAVQPADLSAIYARRDGSLAAHVYRLRDQVIRVQAILETAVDFSEEYSTVLEQLLEPLSKAIHECSLTTQRFTRFKERIFPKIALAGRPNAGKSSLFNALLNRTRALVHEKPGTTRDVIEETVELSGVQCRLVDTAGLRTAQDQTERAGIELGRDYLQASSAWVLVVDGQVGIGEQERELLETVDTRHCFVFWNKNDLEGYKRPTVNAIEGSATTGEGVGELWEAIDKEMSRNRAEDAPLPSQSQFVKLQAAQNDLVQFKTGLEQGEPPEVLSEKCRQIINGLEEVIGNVDHDEVLGRIFSDFCIGK